MTVKMAATPIPLYSVKIDLMEKVAMAVNERNNNL